AFAGLSDSFNFVYVSGEGATQTPGPLTPFFGRIKGQCETALIDLSKKHPSLRPYSVRPAYVDPAHDPKVLEAMRRRPDQQTLTKKALHTVMGPVMRGIFTKSDSPTQHLGRFLTDVARGDGAPFKAGEGEGVSGGGWIISNVAFRRAVGI
ncbi:uncharacterized protein BJX67DRAFT_385195, partial [Aspergillus lucknowensis]